MRIWIWSLWGPEVDWEWKRSPRRRKEGQKFFATASSFTLARLLRFWGSQRDSHRVLTGAYGRPTRPAKLTERINVRKKTGRGWNEYCRRIKQDIFPFNYTSTRINYYSTYTMPHERRTMLWFSGGDSHPMKHVSAPQNCRLPWSLLGELKFGTLRLCINSLDRNE